MPNVPDQTTLTGAIVDLLEAIRRDNDYLTNLGQNVLVGLNANPSEAPCVVLSPEQETLADRGGIMGHVDISYAIAAFLNSRDEVVPEYTANPAAPFALIDAAIQDIRTAIEGSVCTLCSVSHSVQYLGANRIFPQSAGENCGAILRYSITTPFRDYMPGQ